jgi:hypothetical protein
MNTQNIDPIPWSQAQAASDADKSITYTACILASISLKEIIAPRMLVDILKGHEPIGDWEPYIGVFFTECPAKIVGGVVEENDLTMQNLEKCWQNLPKPYQTLHFKEVCLHVFPK